MLKYLNKILRDLAFIQQSEPGKPLWKAKRFWLFILSLAVILAQVEYGWIIDAEAQMGILALINFLIGLLTKSATGFCWEEKDG